VTTEEEALRDYPQVIKVTGLLEAADPAYWAQIMRLAKAELAQTAGLDWNQAFDMLKDLGLTTTGADHVLMTARVQGDYQSVWLVVTRLSISPERFRVLSAKTAAT
jgi:hypothetical protein